MRFLVIPEPNTLTPPPELLPSLLAAEKEWRNRYADRLDGYAWFASGGGTGIIDVDDGETLFQAVSEHPFCPFTKIDVRPLGFSGGGPDRPPPTPTRARQAPARAFCFSASNSACVIAPLSSSCFPFAICSAGSLLAATDLM